MNSLSKTPRRRAFKKVVGLATAAHVLRTNISVLSDLREFLSAPVETSDSDRPRYVRDELWIFWRKMGFTEEESKKMIDDPDYEPDFEVAPSHRSIP